ncbi:MAG: hypothetical protein WCY58_12440 [Mariniphaga sp.]|nr:hypothetical protein [Mariniphaga sp.]MDD4224972.1 hypothetical protein [Mariniphaga sp.]MDD4424619.1 hypothetical protein [Mariniphaga sp.]
MNKIKKIVNPMLILILTGVILLVSNLSNRKGRPQQVNNKFKIAIINWSHALFTEKVDSGIFQQKEKKFDNKFIGNDNTRHNNSRIIVGIQYEQS